MRFTINILFIIALLGFVAFVILYNPLLFVKKHDTIEKSAQSDRLYAHVDHLTTITPSRSAQNIESLNEAAAYITSQFAEAGCSIEVQKFTVGEKKYKNIICSFGTEHDKRVIVGAHYDVHYDNTPGADDNASGVAGILEIARMVGEKKPELPHRIDLIAYALEELPHFGTKDMGSSAHAQWMKAENQEIKVMVSAEMIGYYSDESHSQGYPTPALRLVYPDQGNFIAVIGQIENRRSVARVKRLMQESADIAVYSINAPRSIPGIAFSDHRSYWDEGYDAVMVTDTSYQRNPHYHKVTDTIDTLDFKKMKEVVDGLYAMAVGY